MSVDCSIYDIERYVRYGEFWDAGSSSSVLKVSRIDSFPLIGGDDVEIYFVGSTNLFGVDDTTGAMFKAALDATSASLKLVTKLDKSQHDSSSFPDWISILISGGASVGLPYIKTDYSGSDFFIDLISTELGILTNTPATSIPTTSLSSITTKTLHPVYACYKKEGGGSIPRILGRVEGLVVCPFSTGYTFTDGEIFEGYVMLPAKDSTQFNWGIGCDSVTNVPLLPPEPPPPPPPPAPTQAELDRMAREAAARKAYEEARRTNNSVFPPYPLIYVPPDPNDPDAAQQGGHFIPRHPSGN